MRFGLAVFLACFPAVLRPQAIAIPQSGFVFDGNTKTFRPVLGVPGAAMLGDALEIHGELHNAGICSPQQFALAAAGREGVVTLFHLDNLKTSEISQSLQKAPDQIVLSAGCRAAVIYSARANRVQILTGLPANPVVAADLIPNLPAAASSLAVSDDGQLVIAAVPHQSVYVIPASSGRAVSLLPIEQDAAVAMHGNQDAILADQHSNSVMLLTNAAASPVTSVLAGPGDGIDSPSAVWFDTRTQNVVVANAGNGRIELLSIAGGVLNIVECRCTLSSLLPLTDRTYQLQAPAPDRPLMILDTGVSPPRAVFVATRELPGFTKRPDSSVSRTSGK